MKHVERLLSGTLIYGLGGVLQRFLGFFLLPLFTSILSPEDYGVLAIVNSISFLFVGLFSLGTGNSMGIIYFQQTEECRKAAVIWTTFVFLLIFGVILYSMAFLMAPSISFLLFATEKYDNCIRAGILTIYLSTIGEPFFSLLRMREQSVMAVSFTITNTLLVSLSSVLFVSVFNFGALGMLAAGIFSNFFLILGALFFIGKRLPFFFDVQLCKRIIKIGFPSVFGLLTLFFVDTTTRQIIQRSLGLEILGIYSIGNSIGMAVMMIVGAFSTAWPPFFMSFVTKHDEAARVFSQVLKTYVAFFGLVSIAFFGLARPVVELMTAPQYHDAYRVIGIIATALIMKGLFLVFLPGFYFTSNLSKQVFIEWIGAVVNVILVWAFVHDWGIQGAAIAVLISNLVISLLAFLFGQKYLKVNYDWPRILLAGTTTLVICISLFNFNAETYQVVSQIIYTILGLAIALGVNYGYVFTSDEKRSIFVFLQRKLKGWSVVGDAK